MADAKVTALTAATALGGTEVLYVVQGVTAKKLTAAQIQTYAAAPVSSHLAETASFVHTAAKVSSDSTVAQGNVEDDLSFLDMAKADGATVQQVTDALTDLLGGTPVGIYTGQGTRDFYQDDFRWSADATSSGLIGESSCLRSAGSSSVGVSNAVHPGVINLSTAVGGTSTINTNVVLYSKFPMFSVGANFEYHVWFRPVNLDANTTVRCGLTDSPTSETPSNAVMIQKGGADSASWRVVTWAGTAPAPGTVTNLNDTAIPTVAGSFIHLHMWRSSPTTVSLKMNTSVGGFPSTWSTEQVVTFAPAVLVHPFVSVKCLSNTTKALDIDRWQSLVYDLNR